jgi:CBS domain-containing protein
MKEMLRASFPLGRIFNVVVRVHISFVLLLALALGYSAVVTGHMTRGFGLWAALCFAVVVRELARAVAAAYAGLRPRAVFLLPVGGLMAFSTQDGAPPPVATRLFTWAGPVSNLFVGLLLLGSAYSLVPQVELIQQPWISLGHILRSVIWTQFALGVVSLLPLPNLQARTIADETAATAASNGSQAPQAPGSANAGAQRFGLKLNVPAIGLGTLLAVVMMIAGAVTMNLWLIFLGGFMLLGAQISNAHQQTMSAAASDGLLVRDVMLTEYMLVSSSDTLEGALQQTVHSLQDVFPVVRGDQLVGSIARQTLVNRLLTEGDGYLQGAMTRTLPVAAPNEPLVDALRRANAPQGNEFIPVAEDGLVVGVLTPQSLSRAVQQVKLVRSRSQRGQ